jgi:neutral ceramidase
MKIGASKISITPDVERTPRTLLGYGDFKHIATRVETPIYARAIALEAQDGKRIIFLCIEICFVSESLGQGIKKVLWERHSDLSLDEAELVITATHTHNAPGGYCHSMLFNFPSYGYHPEVFDLYVEGSVKAILHAWERREEGQLYFQSGDIPLTEPVAFNRSIDAWNQNPDVTHYSFQDRDHALYRNMDVLFAKSSSGKPLGLISWFAVHCTSIHRDLKAIHSDNKGIASLLIEEFFHQHGAEHGVAIFTQGAAGDVSPNFKKYWFKRETRGAYRDDLKSCNLNGKIQSDFAIQLAMSAKPLESQTIDSVLTYHDMTQTPIPPEWVNGQAGLHTGPAELGCPFMAGTAEGTATSIYFARFIELALRVVYFLKRRQYGSGAQGNKAPCIELTKGRVFGESRPEDLPVPGFIDPSIQVLRFWSKIRVFRNEPMSPYIMPIQLVRIGELGFASLPGEFTTQAGVRLRSMLGPLLSPLGIRHIITNGYANSYAGYVTTQEEYQLQRFEGSMTHFGRYTLLGYMAVFRQLAERWTGKPLSAPVIPDSAPPDDKSPEYLKKISARLFHNRKNKKLLDELI